MRTTQTPTERRDDWWSAKYEAARDKMGSAGPPLVDWDRVRAAVRKVPAQRQHEAWRLVSSRLAELRTELERLALAD